MQKLKCHLISWLGMAGILIGSTGGSMVLAQSSESMVEFRVDTDIYVDTTRPPLATTQTFFLQHRVVDWDDGRRRLMCIDLRTQQVELADFGTQRRCRLDIGTLASQLVDLKSQLTPEQTQAWVASREPKADGEAYLLESGNLRYRFRVTNPFQPSAAAAYAEFADLSVQVSAIYPPYKPPLLRLQLNDFLRKNSVLPVEIQLTDLRSKANDCINARVLIQPALTSQDRERVKDWDVLVQTLKLVPAGEFFQAERNARQKQGVLK
jgi:hypothetical protein